MEISSSSDFKHIQELCGDLSVRICYAEIEFDSVFSHLKDLKGTIKYFKEVMDDAHAKSKDERREDILCFHSIADNMRSELLKVDGILAALRKEVDENLNN